MIQIEKFHNEMAGIIRNMANVYLQKQFANNLYGRAKRGRLVSAASDFQDALALFLVKLLPVDYQIFVDYPISYSVSSNTKARTFYPDILLVKEDTIEGIFELKIDLGYAPPDWLAKKKKEFDRINRAGIVSYISMTRENNRETKELYVSPNVIEAFVVFSAFNDHGKLAKLKGSSKLFVLTGEWHPNNPALSSEDIESIIGAVSSDPENLKEWRRLMEFLSSNFGPLNLLD